MKDLLQLVLLISGLIPATFLAYLCLLFLTSKESSLYIIYLLGLIGYMGMFLLLLEHRVNNWLIIALLSAGILSFILFIFTMGLWDSFVMFKPPLAMLIFIWPSFIALLNITRLITKTLKPRQVKY